jgi:phage shock protein PspC (stress-responsive transcriptional regulator)
MNTTYESAPSSTSDETSQADPQAGSQPGGQALRRPAEGRMIAGVAAGVARSLGIDPVIVRVAFLVLALAGGAGVPLYIAGWLLIPDEASGESLATQLIQSVSAGR